ncbi:MAG: HNH endonuclease [Leptolyngbya sp. SIO1E4]|nr:HNH endonuclease [Leptolyngbya sp. SIO1E4]
MTSAQSLESLYWQIKHRRRYAALKQLHPGHCKRPPAWQWQQLRQRVYELADGICQSPEQSSPKSSGHCLDAVSLDVGHCDHIIPLSSGGHNHISNLRWLCPVCHAWREGESHASLRSCLIKKGVVPHNNQPATWV